MERTNLPFRGSGTEFALIEIQRDKDEDKQVTITATITKGDESVTKDFVITLKRARLP